MFERFSANARQVVVLAQEEARGLNHNYIGTEHVLLGLLNNPETTAARALAQCGVEIASVREQVVEAVGIGKKLAKGGHIPFTPRAKKVLELGLREALRMGHNYIGTEHILLGIIREGEGLAATILAKHTNYERLRQAVVDLIPQGRTTKSRRGWFRGRVADVVPDAVSDADEPNTTPAADVSLAEARRLAGSDAIGSHHLLMAALSDSRSAAAKALGTLGVDLEKAREALREVDVAGTSDELPEEAGRRHMRLRLADDAMTLEIDDPRLVAEMRAALGALGGEAAETNTISGDSPEGSGFADAWQALHSCLDEIARRATPGT
jgi:ATP-dependent Clp protease ATP-binding subunit ClpA